VDLDIALLEQDQVHEAVPVEVAPEVEERAAPLADLEGGRAREREKVPSSACR
jgi:hypothetical protein